MSTTSQLQLGTLIRNSMLELILTSALLFGVTTFVRFGEGPTTNLTNVVTPKSNAEVRISSSMLLRINVPNCSCDVVLISRYQNAKQSHPRLHMPASPKTQRCLW